MTKSWTGIIGLLVIMGCNSESTTDSTTAASTTPDTKTPPQSEFADPKYTDVGKKSVAALQAGDVDGFTANLADNAVFLWSSGDSLVGKQAITDYWKNR